MSRSYLRPATLLAFASMLVASAWLPAAAAAVTTTHDVTFSVQDASPYGLAANSTVAASRTALGTTWNEQTQAGSISRHNLEIMSADFGATIDAHTNGQIGATFAYDVQQGELDISFPAKITIDYPDPETFFPGKPIEFATHSLQATPGTIAYSPGIQNLELGATFEFDGGVSANICPGVCTGEIPIVPNIDMAPASLTLFNMRIDRSAADTVRAFSEEYTELTGIAGTIASPTPIISTTTSTTTGLQASGSHEQVDVSLDVDKLSKYPWGRSLPAAAPVHASYDIIDGKVYLKVGQDHEFDFRPTVRTAFALPTAMQWVEVTPQGVQVASGTSADPTITVGNTLRVILPVTQTQPFEVTPTLSIANRIRHGLYQRLRTSGRLQVLRASIGIPSMEIIPSFELCDPTGFLDAIGVDDCTTIGGLTVPGYSTSVGPVYDYEFVPLNERHPLFDEEWSVPGFAPHRMAAHELDPENMPVADAGGPYLVDEGSSISLDASASFDHDLDDDPLLTYDWVLDGPGSIDASGVAPQFDGLDGPHIYVATVTVCDLKRNCDTATAEVRVANVAPTHELDTSTIVDFGGGPAFLARVGVASPHAATARDAGTDDTTYAWSADTAAAWQPASTTYLNDGVAPDLAPSALGTLPFVSADATTVTYDIPGYFTATLLVTDDDGGSTTSSRPVLVADASTTIRSIGWFTQQYSGRGARKLTDVQLAGYLDFVEAGSRVFAESAAIATDADAYGVLSRNSGAYSKREQLHAVLLASWLNVASGAVAYGDVADTLAEAETVALDETASDGQLNEARKAALAIWG